MDKDRVLAVMERNAQSLRSVILHEQARKEEEARTAVAEVYARVERLEAENAALRAQVEKNNA